ncbi:MAG: indolepyruvate ferredoxin oxidoreductase subunit alpha [Pseudomonadota bacterium]
MAERSFKKEVQHLKLGDGAVFKGEGILAITKGLLQSGVSYVGGYQGSPISHLMDVLADAQDILSELGVHFEQNGSEATAASMLSASIHYPLRGAVAWKSTVGTNVASDALANLASSGVIGGAMVVVGEDYGEGSSIMQERTHAFAMKSQMWLLDPRPDLPHIVDMIEHGFALSEASNTPLFLMVRIRTCHVTGEFVAKDNVAPQYNATNAVEPDRQLDRIILPPLIFEQERDKVARRLPLAIDYITEHGLNEVFEGESDDVGLILQGGLYNTVIRALERLGLSDAYGNSRIPLYVMNVTYPLIPEELTQFCVGKRHVLMIEEGQPNYIEQELSLILRKGDVQAQLHGKDILPGFGEFTGKVAFEGIAEFLTVSRPKAVDIDDLASRRQTALLASLPKELAQVLQPQIVARPAGLCTGCPERPLFSAVKQVQETHETDFHISADIGCHSFATLAPFNLGSTIMGYGFSLASSSAIRAKIPHRAISVMGDGGFWHNGLSTGVSSAVFNNHDGVLIIVDNGYSAATGGQDIPSFVKPENLIASTRIEREDNQPIEAAVRGVGVEWVRTVYTYDIARMKSTLEEALSTDYDGLKVIIAEGECMLNKQRRVKPQLAKRINDGMRTVRERFVVDSETCTGDHACIRLSGCPSLTIKENPDPMRVDPVAYVDNSCVGCGVCGGNAHSAVLCPSFARAELVYNPSGWDRFITSLRESVIGFLQGRLSRQREARTL